MRALAVTAALAVSAGVACLLAAAAEIVRFVLVLRGRAEVLPAATVRISDSLVVSTGLVAVFASVAAVIGILSVLGPLTAFAASRAHCREPRSAGSRLGRLLIPGFNLYGAPVVLAETDVLLRRGSLPVVDSRIRPARLVAWWAIAWVINGLLVVAVLVRSQMSGVQALADRVELTIAVDLAGAVVAGLTAALLVRFRRLAQHPRPRLTRWTVLPARAPAIRVDTVEENPTPHAEAIETLESAENSEADEPEPATTTGSQILS